MAARVHPDFSRRDRYSMKNNFSAGSKTLSALVFGASLWMSLGMSPATAAAPVTGAVIGLPDFADLVDQVGPAVVNIRTTERPKQGKGAAGLPGDDDMQELLRRFFGGQLPPGAAPNGRGQRRGAAPSDEPVNRGVGSGFILSADGYVMTNAHVVDGADEVFVTLTDKREFTAKVLGADTSTDVAVLKIEGDKLPFLVMGNSDK